LECAGTTALCQAVSSNARTVALEKAATRRRTPEMSRCSRAQSFQDERVSSHTVAECLAKTLDSKKPLLYCLSILQNPESGIYYPFFEPDVNVRGHLEHVG